MPRKRGRNADKMAKAVILQRLEKMLLRGVSNQTEMAAAFGVSQVMVCGYIKELYQRWRDERPEDIELARITRVKQLDGITLMALNEFERSKKASEDFTITSKMCTACKGDGDTIDSMGETVKCRECGGSGEIKTQVVRVVEKTGDPAYLAIAKATIETAAKIEGVLANQSMGKMSTILRETRAVGGEIHEKAKEITLEAPTDVIVKAMAMMDQIKQKMRIGEVKAIESQTIETTAEVVEDDDSDSDDEIEDS